jgi:hypothetical protein
LAIAAEPQPKLSLLIVDGMNNHDWPRKVEKALLESQPKNVELGWIAFYRR